MYWTPCTKDSFPPGRKAGGLCQSDKITEYYGGPYEKNMLIYPYHENGHFWTGPEFGCVNFKAT